MAINIDSSDVRTLVSADHLVGYDASTSEWVVFDAAAVFDADVATVFGRTGAVVAVAGDYAASEVTNDSGVTGATVADALDTLDAAISAASALPVDDTTSLVQDPADNTKLVRIDAGALATGTTRVIVMGDRDVDLASGGTFAELVHNHAASAITSGTLTVARGGTGAGTLTGLVKGNGTSAFTAAVAGVDYAAASHTHTASAITSGQLAVANGGTGAASLTGLVKGNGTSAFTAAISGTDYAAASHTHAASDIASGQLGVANGGTGAASLTDGGILLGSGTGAITAMAVLAAGSIVVGDGTTDPVALTTAAASEGDVLTVQAGGTIDWAAPTGGGASALDDLSDVTITTPASGDVIYYDGADWINADLAAAGIAAASHEHSGADITSGVVAADYGGLGADASAFGGLVKMSGGVASVATAGTDYASPSITISASGLATGGGSLAANRTITVSAASQANQETGTATNVAVTPGVQKYHPSAAKAWAIISVNGSGVPSVTDSYGVSSVTDVAVGQMGLQFSPSFSSANYCAVNGGVAFGGDDNIRVSQASSSYTGGIYNTASAGYVDRTAPYSYAFYGDV